MRAIILSILVVFLVGCNTAPIRIESKPIERIPLVLPAVDLYEGHDTKWIVITPTNAEKVFASLSKKGIPLAIIGVTGDTYKILGVANGDKRKLIQQLNAQIKAYEKYYIAVEKRDEEHNKKVVAPE